MRKLAAAQHTEFKVWVFTRAELARFVMVEILFSSALYAGLKRVNGHEVIAILGSSIGTHLYKYWRPDVRIMGWRAGRQSHSLPWSQNLDGSGIEHSLTG
ncbi:hypothetical protein MUG84_09295 [Paenibacillus sp. KQZ6P-2]|uniref:Uncharacterized protein n=1 Tax=Paenibacillus mangrovi TaxID=2931978 RepID=A0A9X1WQ64_9BACL|nr:hypothetical protein [Paenibacillus mangrovi]MCJ8011935.1 hypothetical protein [Paenibacillus mangrovi]